MSVIATVEVPAEEFTLGPALATNPGIRVRIERVVPLGDAFLPYLWVSDDDLETVETSLREEADIESFEIIDEVADEVLVRVEWASELDGLLEALADSDGVILEATGGDDVWRFQLRFPTHEDLTAFYQQAAAADLHIDLQSVHNPGPPTNVGVGIDLSDTQRNTLVSALEAGYFDVPRRINLVELSERMGISDTAVSQRIRRGTKRLLETTLDGTDEDADDT
ncbi:bacterio-opsin activator domain-containing protein [Halorarius halobius]|uniref:helix-turn-helix domain-containing protein n=1 Tax=Halorarius halobius TaxID=2962671 RepID=UPI0020CFE35C|nr:bacterio-opsin activator domain-containing protein [Halorarius halobius]